MTASTPNGATELLPLTSIGRRFTDRRRVRLGQASASGQLRLDALAEYLQDVASDDARDAEIDGHLAWVVRRLLIEVDQPPLVEEEVELTTFCTGYGGRWAERGTTIRGIEGGRADAVALWVQIDTTSGRPKRLGDDFFLHYGEAAAGREVRARLEHPDPPEGTTARHWLTRLADLDILDHINNAVYGQALEEVIGTIAPDRRCRAEIEYRGGVAIDDAVEVIEATTAGTLRQWFMVDGAVRASTMLRPLV